MDSEFVPIVSSLSKTLEQFYSKVVGVHQNHEQKIEILELFLSKINEQINSKIRE